MKSNWKRIGVMVAVITLVGALGLASVASAQSSDDESNWPNFREMVREAIADVLGISVEEYDAAEQAAYQQVIEQAVADGVLTQEQADQMLERMEGGFGFKGMPFGRGRMGGRMGGWMGGPENSLIAVAADQLDLTVEELLAELQDGQTIAEVVEAQGADPQTIADAFIAARAEILAEAVAEGRITQEQADEMLARMTEEVTEHLNEAFPCGEERGPGGRRGQLPGDFGRDGQWPGSRRPGGRWPGGTERFGGFPG